MGIGKKLEQLLTERETNANELARKLNVTPSTIYSMIKRDSKKADITLLVRISEIFGVDTAYFCDDFQSRNIITIQFDSTEYTQEQLKRIKAFAKFIKEEGE